MGGRSAWKSSQVSDVTSLYHHHHHDYPWSWLDYGYGDAPYAPYGYGGCQEDGLDCRSSRCCARENSRCFVKNEHWATCNSTCFKFTKWEGSYHHGHWVHTDFPVWNCKDITDDHETDLAALDDTVVGANHDEPGYRPPFEYGGCQEDGLDCRDSRCCAREGSRCYRKNEHWATCNQTCLKFTSWEGSWHHGRWVHTSYPVWDCEDLTTDDPQRRLHSPPNPIPGIVLPPSHYWSHYWPSPEYYESVMYGGCPEDGHDCRYSRCCAREGSRCFVKNERWASCNETCFPFTQWEGAHHHGHWRHTHHPVWDCTDITAEE